MNKYHKKIRYLKIEWVTFSDKCHVELYLMVMNRAILKAIEFNNSKFRHNYCRWLFKHIYGRHFEWDSYKCKEITKEEFFISCI